MNDLVIDGKKYISSKRAAEITKYSKDYVGQLARSGKIQARLVGRSWYIDEDSIIAHSERKSEVHVPTGHEEIALDSETHTSQTVVEVAHDLEEEGVALQENNQTLESGDDSVLDVESKNAASDESVSMSGGVAVEQLKQPIEHQEVDEVAGKRVVGSNGWRSLWGIPVYEKDDRELMPHMSKEVTHDKDEYSDEQSRSADTEVELAIRRDEVLYERAQSTHAVTKKTSDQRSISRIRLTENENKKREPIQYNYSDTSKKTNVINTSTVYAIGVVIAVFTCIALTLVFIISLTTGKDGNASGGVGIFDEVIHYTR